MRRRGKNTTAKLLIYGASGHAKVVADAALACGFEIIGLKQVEGMGI